MIKPLGPYPTVVSIELYTAHVVVRFVDDRGFPTDSEEFAKRQLVLTDDSGTTYQSTGGSSYVPDGMTVALLGDALFTPGTSPVTESLRLGADEAQIDVAI